MVDLLYRIELDLYYKTGPKVIKLFSCSTQLSMKFLMLISINISRNSAFFSGSDKPRMPFFLLINVKVGILTFMSMKNFMLSRVEHEKFYNLGARSRSLRLF